MEFSQKIVYIISHEAWGSMLMSKHHYAIELSKSGSVVYFINHPDRKHHLKRGEIKVEATNYNNLYVVQSRLFHPYFFKYKFNSIYNFLTKFHIWNIQMKIGKKPDIVWTFDTGNSLPLKYFSASNCKIYMPVDGPYNDINEARSAETASVIISVTNRILDRYKDINVPKLQINHGVSSVFISDEIIERQNERIRVGYSGSLIRNDLDNDLFLKIIQAHPEIDFEFWGEIDPKSSNIHLPQDVSSNTIQFIDKLKSLENVKLHGAVDSKTLSEGLKKVDILLICYKIKNDQNHHKVLEYLGIGKVIVSSYMSSYVLNNNGLIEMLENTENNNGLFEIFEKVVKNLDDYNSSKNQNKRIGFAKQFTYQNQIKKIAEFISANK